MANHTPETSTIDKLFLELSQFTKAKTNTQITLEYKLSEAEKTIERLCDEFNNDNGPMHMGEPIISNQFMDKLATVTAQRDELLAAISKCLSESNACVGGIVELSAQLGKIRAISNAAIAKCEVKNGQ